MKTGREDEEMFMLAEKAEDWPGVICDLTYLIRMWHGVDKLGGLCPTLTYTDFLGGGDQKNTALSWSSCYTVSHYTKANGYPQGVNHVCYEDYFHTYMKSLPFKVHPAIKPAVDMGGNSLIEDTSNDKPQTVKSDEFLLAKTIDAMLRHAQTLIHMQGRVHVRADHVGEGKE